MLTSLALLSAGLLALVYGADRVVAAAAGLAEHAGVSALFVGVTVVAVGSSVPEIATAAYAALYGAGTLAVGHIVGSATAQITLGIGLVAVVSPLTVPRNRLAVYGGGMLGAMAVMLAVTVSGVVTRVEGVVMCACYLGFLAVVVDRTDFADHATDHDGIHEPRRAVAWLACGLALVLVGGHLLVTEGRAFALAVGLPSYFVGAITGLGTTIPEIVVALQAVREGESGIAVGTLLGSNVTDPLFSLGFGAAVGGLHVAHVHRILSPAAYMLAVSALVVAVFALRPTMGRRTGLVVAALYLPTFLLV
ncbi:LOW QUALITY PROTEIN: K+-dependent Na+/Ca+ exchanger related-protein [Halarchaeum acidiphilum MH1-52-1]|uniref:K+-dependent Na+/Ca+ exchanger related-protein n=1 Tax=Halarchaeum acidiphilum MH1-52-1 TaxID=1261545 RepID=U3A287_9EURY|nr:LOW QUALITY PROTEIN: K+-dependent Na+/Ca+ exchanger related-protein [Halarchaeum acidiphilum MH1-52-1]